MELYNVPNRTYVRVLPQLDGDNPDDQREMSEKAKDILGLDVSKETRIPPAAPLIEAGELIFFDHIDSH